MRWLILCKVSPQIRLVCLNRVSTTNNTFTSALRAGRDLTPVLWKHPHCKAVIPNSVKFEDARMVLSAYSILSWLSRGMNFPIHFLTQYMTDPSKYSTWLCCNVEVSQCDVVTFVWRVNWNFKLESPREEKQLWTGAYFMDLMCFGLARCLCKFSPFNGNVASKAALFGLSYTRLAKHWTENFTYSVGYRSFISCLRPTSHVGRQAFIVLQSFLLSVSCFANLHLIILRMNCVRQRGNRACPWWRHVTKMYWRNKFLKHLKE